MELFVGLDVSMDETSICVVDRDGKIIKECKAAMDPAAIHGALKTCTDRLRRVGLVFTLARQTSHENGAASDRRRGRSYAESAFGPAK